MCLYKIAFKRYIIPNKHQIDTHEVNQQFFEENISCLSLSVKDVKFKGGVLLRACSRLLPQTSSIICRNIRL